MRKPYSAGPRSGGISSKVSGFCLPLLNHWPNITEIFLKGL